MKDKKKIGIVIYSIICVVIVAVCLIIQFVIKNEDKKLQKEKEKLEILTIKTESGVEIETEYYSFDNSKFYLKIPKSTSKAKVEEMLENKISPTKKPDVDNIAKSILDAMNNFVFKDDNQVSKISVEKRFALEEKAVIEVEEY